jgi:hypothetical protein
LLSITDDDFPNLVRVTGDVIMSSLYNSGADSPRLRTVTFSKLRSIDGSLRTLVTGLGSIRELYFPALTTVGTERSNTQVNIASEDTVILDLSALTTINGSLFLSQLNHLCSLKLGNLSRVTSAIQINSLFNIPWHEIKALNARVTIGSTVEQNQIGCCLDDSWNCEMASEVAGISCGC